MKKLIYLLLMVIIPSSFMAQSSGSDSPFNIGVAVGVSGSTNGLGVSAITALGDRFAVRLSYEKLDKTFTDATEFDISDRTFDVYPSVKAGGVSAIVDFYMLKNLYVSAGVVSTNMNLGAKILSADPVKIGDIEYTPDQMGELRLAVKPENKIAPYLALGVGRNISRDNKFAVSFEVGMYYTKAYVVDLSGTNFFEGNNENTSVDNLNQTLADMSWSGIYPIVKLGFSYKLYSNKK